MEAVEEAVVLEPGVNAANEGQFLTFMIGEQQYGVEIKYVTEIIGIQNITSLPDLPHFMKGIINLRGKVIPVVDVRLRFGMEERDYDERTCIIVVSINDTNVGLVVDTVAEVMNIPEESIEPPPKVNSKANGNRFIYGLGKVQDNVQILLDTQKLLFDEELEQLSAIT